MNKTKKKRQKTGTKVYSKGNINRLIDDLVHPLCNQNAGLFLLDGFLHSLVEQNPPLSVRKFIRYNLPKLLKNVSEG
jgi:hypothetical protein